MAALRVRRVASSLLSSPETTTWQPGANQIEMFVVIAILKLPSRRKRAVWRSVP